MVDEEHDHRADDRDDQAVGVESRDAMPADVGEDEPAYDGAHDAGHDIEKDAFAALQPARISQAQVTRAGQLCWPVALDQCAAGRIVAG